MAPTDPYGTGAPSGSPFPYHEASSDSVLSSDNSNSTQLQPIAHLSMEDRIEQMRRDTDHHEPSQSGYFSPHIDPSLDSLPQSFPNLAGGKRPYAHIEPEDNVLPPVAPRGNAHQLVAALKSHKKYRPSSVALLDSWADCQTNIKKYTNCIILSPKLTAYRGNIALAVLNTMCELHIHELPAAEHEDRIQAVITEISTKATTARNMIKKLVLYSLGAPSRHRHISDLCHALIKKSVTGLAMTTYTQVHMPFIHTVICETSDTKETWELVDKRLHEWEERNPTPEKFQEAMKINYRLDQEDFPCANTDLAMRPVTLTKDLKKWQTVCDHHAGKAGTEKVGRRGRA
ncbi:hypothetical protein JB92DRAFT_3123545 [Gautieria morchelliformis]|nr:hypothetical protein JB92DRAFT_3123545 [Gautieria morchelliformis]